MLLRDLALREGDDLGTKRPLPCEFWREKDLGKPKFTRECRWHATIKIFEAEIATIIV